MLSRRLPQVVTAVALLCGCTPLGLWIYQDPAVRVSRVRLDANRSTRTPILVALAVRNPNDYELTAVRVEVQLRLDQVPVGLLDRDTVVTLASDTVSTVTMPLLLATGTTSDHLRVFQSGTHSFLVEGRATVTTPVGQRRIRFADAGDMRFEAH
ncbi:MAG: LEA type 2 family protein [Gemmatimonadales bacterium]